MKTRTTIAIAAELFVSSDAKTAHASFQHEKTAHMERKPMSYYVQRGNNWSISMLAVVTHRELV
jgi:hypothetical protein